MAKITYYLTDAAHLDSIDVATGNLLFCEDTKRIYLDNNDRRVCYDSIMVFETDLDRYNYSNPVAGFYFVSETKVLWRYEDDEWSSITEPPSHDVIFTPKEDLPIQGSPEVLYVCDDKHLYVWNSSRWQYENINADSIWREV